VSWVKVFAKNDLISSDNKKYADVSPAAPIHYLSFDALYISMDTKKIIHAPN